MKAFQNPFEYDAATSLSPDQILDFYIEDYSFSRFLQSTRNVFLVGERGSGKTMALLFNSYPVQARRKPQTAVVSFERLGIYVPCNTPLTHRREYELLNEFQSSVISEHFFVLAILFSIADTLQNNPDSLSTAEDKSLTAQYSYLLNAELPAGGSFFKSVSLFAQKEITQTQQVLNAGTSESFYPKALSFSSAIMGLFDLLRKTKAFFKTHFMIMIDDAHYLNPFQIRALNSWIAYRDHSQFSFKVACAKVEQPDFHTATGGSILEGHDFALVDMEQPYQFETSSFGRMARQIIERRLQRINVKSSPDDFFPISTEFQKELKRCEQVVAERARALYPKGPAKRIRDYIYKYARAEYFRSRSSKANRPQYSGFETITYLSTGIIRNLLEPCFWMYDKAKSLHNETNPKEHLLCIPPSVQREIILQRSDTLWETIQEKLPKIVSGCSQLEARRIRQLFDHLSALFRERMLRHKSEPRANSFTISGLTPELEKQLMPLLNIARRAQLLYVRSGVAKDEGKREAYYVPNRMLWPARGLDPQGQHARVSLKARDICSAAFQNKPFPFVETDTADTTEVDLNLFQE